jgi:hypothetical protein
MFKIPLDIDPQTRSRVPLEPVLIVGVRQGDLRAQTVGVPGDGVDGELGADEGVVRDAEGVEGEAYVGFVEVLVADVGVLGETGEAAVGGGGGGGGGGVGV